MNYKGRHRTNEEFDRAEWAEFLYGLWAMRVAEENDVAEGLSYFLNADYQLIRRWLAQTQEVMAADIQYVADMCGIDARLLMEKVNRW